MRIWALPDNSGPDPHGGEEDVIDRKTLFLLALLALGAGILASIPGSRLQEPALLTGTSRLASLAPCLTSTLVALGGKDRLALISDYCPPVGEVPRGGTALSPDLERVMRSGANVVLARAAAGVPVDAIRRVGTPVVLPWSSVAEMCESVLLLGELSGCQNAAKNLVHDLQSGLAPRNDDSGPRVLLVIGGPIDRSGGPWVIREDSLHGQTLKAAGYRHAFQQPLRGAPQLSVETLIELDPDVIVHLIPEEADGDSRRLVRESYSGIPGLRAWKENRIGVIHDPWILDEGPGLLALVDQLRLEISDLSESAGKAKR